MEGTSENIASYRTNQDEAEEFEPDQPTLALEKFARDGSFISFRPANFHSAEDWAKQNAERGEGDTDDEEEGEEGAPNRLRRFHSKSRGGCRYCKLKRRKVSVFEEYIYPKSFSRICESVFVHISLDIYADAYLHPSKCDETKPSCLRCIRLGRDDCVYENIPEKAPRTRVRRPTMRVAPKKPCRRFVLVQFKDQEDSGPQDEDEEDFEELTDQQSIAAIPVEVSPSFQTSFYTYLSQGGLADTSPETVETLTFFCQVTCFYLPVNLFFKGVWEFITFDVAYEVFKFNHISLPISLTLPLSRSSKMNPAMIRLLVELMLASAFYSRHLGKLQSLPRPSKVECLNCWPVIND